MPKRMLLIINPCSGTKQGAKRMAELVAIFQRGGYVCTTLLTDKREAATEFVRNHGESHDAIVCVGGDGTFNETVNGLIESGLDLPIGFIPAGSTNDFAESLHLSTNYVNAADDIVSGGVRLLDIGQFGNRGFSYVASFGAFTKTSYSTSQSFKNAFGHLAYILSGAMDVLSIRSEHMRFEIPNRSLEGDYIFGAISNSTSLGGVLTIDPSLVDMSDGKFEVLLIKQPKNMNELIRITNALTRKRYDCDMLEFFSTERIIVHSDSSIDWSLDGEKVTAAATTDVRNLHQAIKLMVKGDVACDPVKSRDSMNVRFASTVSALKNRPFLLKRESRYLV